MKKITCSYLGRFEIPQDLCVSCGKQIGEERSTVITENTNHEKFSFPICVECDATLDRVQGIESKKTGRMWLIGIPLGIVGYLVYHFVAGRTTFSIAAFLIGVVVALLFVYFLLRKYLSKEKYTTDEAGIVESVKVSDTTPFAAPENSQDSTITFCFRNERYTQEFQKLNPLKKMKVQDADKQISRYDLQRVPGEINNTSTIPFTIQIFTQEDIGKVIDSNKVIEPGDVINSLVVFNAGKDICWPAVCAKCGGSITADTVQYDRIIIEKLVPKSTQTSIWRTEYEPTRDRTFDVPYCHQCVGDPDPYLRKAYLEEKWFPFLYTLWTTGMQARPVRGVCYDPMGGGNIYLRFLNADYAQLFVKENTSS
jgi:hypothetical protein